jgi:hypothetical protein
MFSRRMFGSVFVVALVAGNGSEARACSVAPDPALENFSPQSDEAPPGVDIAQISTTLGRNYGGSGPGDCSELGTVDIALTPTDGASLDDRFGARLTITAGKLPATFVPDLTTRNLPIRQNRVRLLVTDRENSTLAFSVTVQLVNASGQLGPISPMMSAEDSSGCTTTGTHRGGSMGPLVLLGSILILRRRALRRRGS